MLAACIVLFLLRAHDRFRCVNAMRQKPKADRMTDTVRISAASPFPALRWSQTDGGMLAPAGMEGWRLLVVYRGAHCPLCRKYLKTLESLQPAFADAGVTVVALSADPGERAIKEAGEEGWTFPVGYDLTPDQMRNLGLYVSSPRTPEEADRDFAEPGLFVINPQGAIQMVDVSNAPFARPDLEDLLNGLKFVIANGYPIRGTA